MPHPRQVIRHAVATLLVGKTAAGARVFRTRRVPYEVEELPALAVYSPDEEVDVDEERTPRQLDRSAMLVIEGCVEAGENPDDRLDDLALEVERAMHADETFGGVAADSMLARTETDTFEDGERTVGLLRLTYSARYLTYAPDTVAVPDDFEEADVQHGDLARDIVPIPQEP